MVELDPLNRKTVQVASPAGLFRKTVRVFSVMLLPFATVTVSAICYGGMNIVRASGMLRKLLFLILTTLPYSVAADRITIEADRIIDGIAANPIEHTVILIDSSQIISLGGRELISPRTPHIKLPGTTLMPGLIDSHSHPLIHAEDYQLIHLQTSSAYKALKGMRSLQRLLAAGWTTIRVMGDSDIFYANQDIRRVIEEGVFEGPRIVGAAHYLSTTAGGGDIRFFSPEQQIVPDGLIVDGVDEMRQAIRQEIKFGADWIKLLVTGAFMSAGDNPQNVHFSPEELTVAVSEADRFGVPVAAHAHANSGIRMAVEAGVRSIEHGTYVDNETMDLMVERGTFLVPTLYIGEVLGDEDSNFREKAANVAFKKKGQANLLARVGEAHRRGVKIAAGVDLGGYHHDPTESAREIAALVKAGLSPMAAIQAATSVGAELLYMADQVGSLESGKFADIIAIPGNPLVDISALERVTFVMKGGRVIKQPSTDD